MTNKSKHPLYGIWTGMKQRCSNPNDSVWPRYGGMGIRVCDEWWHDFERFANDVGPRPSLRHSIDRYPDKCGHYEPGNVRWATREEQRANRRQFVAPAPTHGVTGYTWRKCRCTICHSAWRQYQDAWKARQPVPACRAVRMFRVSVAGTDWSQVIFAHTRGKAKRAYYNSVTDAWPDIPFTAMRCVVLDGPPVTSDEFLRVAAYRGVPSVRCGQRVQVGKGRGVIVGHNSSANFNVLFDTDSPQYPGERLNVHPASIDFAPNDAGEAI